MRADQSFEQELSSLFAMHGIEYQDNTGSFSEPDFLFTSARFGYTFHLEAKEKRQRINLANWPGVPEGLPEPHLFLLDDLSARKLLRKAPYSGVLVRDFPQRRYVLFTVLHLLTMPKVRVNRSLAGGGLKGKWYVDLRHGDQAISLVHALGLVTAYATGVERDYSMPQAWGSYQGEAIGRGGILRTEEHRRTDVEVTR